MSTGSDRDQIRTSSQNEQEVPSGVIGQAQGTGTILEKSEIGVQQKREETWRHHECRHVR